MVFALSSETEGKMVYLSREEILSVHDIVTEEVDVPEWGGIVRVRGMSGVQRDAFEASLIQQPTGQPRAAAGQAGRNQPGEHPGKALRMVHRR